MEKEKFTKHVDLLAAIARISSIGTAATTSTISSVGTASTFWLG